MNTNDALDFARFRSDTMSLDTLLIFLKKGATSLECRTDTVLNPSEVVENVLLGAPVPSCYRVDTWKQGDESVRRRLVSSHLVALVSFMAGEFALSGLTILPGLNGFTFEGDEKPLPSWAWDRLLNARVNITVLDCMPEELTAEFCRRFGL